MSIKHTKSQTTNKRAGSRNAEWDTGLIPLTEFGGGAPKKLCVHRGHLISIGMTYCDSQGI